MTRRDSCSLTEVPPAAAESIFPFEWGGLREALCSDFLVFFKSSQARASAPHPHAGPLFVCGAWSFWRWQLPRGDCVKWIFQPPHPSPTVPFAYSIPAIIPSPASALRNAIQLH